MKLELIPLKLAIKLANKNFDIITDNIYSKYGRENYVIKTYHPKCYQGEEPVYLAPKIDLVVKWLREKYRLMVQIDYGSLSDKFWYYILDMNKNSCVESGLDLGKSTYEQAQIAGIEEALKLIKD